MITLTMPFPPSVNSMWRTPRSGPLAGRTMLSQEGRAYRSTVQAIALAQAWPKHGDKRLSVSIEARMPDRRKRDLDNLPKAVLDALTHAGIWLDDGQIDDLRVWRSPKPGGVILVTITPLTEVQSSLLEATA